MPNLLNFNIMEENFNDLATDLFKNLINNGYNYIDTCSNYSIIYVLNNTRIDIWLEDTDFKEFEPLVIKPRPYSYCIPEFFNSTLDTKSDNITFNIMVNSNKYCVHLSRVEIAEYRDKIDDMINHWHKDQMKRLLYLLKK